jgi:hypothetical protein
MLIALKAKQDARSLGSGCANKTSDRHFLKSHPEVRPPHHPLEPPLLGITVPYLVCGDFDVGGPATLES